MPAARAVTASIPAFATPPGARIGIDLVHAARIAASMPSFGDRFAHRLFVAGERRDATVAGRLDSACDVELTDPRLTRSVFASVAAIRGASSQRIPA
jgi:hypothetical protein